MVAPTMFRRFLLLPLLCGVGMGLPPLAAEKAGAQDAARLIKQLGSSDAAARQKAYQQLQAIGESALKALQKAAVDNPDIHVRKQAKELAAAIQQRLDVARLLTPHRLRLAYKDTPLRAALADIKKQFGCDFLLEDPVKKLAGRRLTLDTGKMTVWEAFDQFCARAGLVAVVPEVSQGSLVLPDGTEIGFQQHPGVGKSSDPLTLREGKKPTVPTHYAGFFRLQARPSSAEEEASDDEIVLSMLLAAWPRFGIAVVGRVHVDKAIDDRGQNLHYMKMQEEGNQKLDIRIPSDSLVEVPDRRFREFALRFKKGDQPSKSLKKVSGGVLTTVLTPAEELVQVATTFQAIGRRVEGKRGTAIQVLEAARDTEGRVQLRLELTMPNEVAPATFPPGQQPVVNLEQVSPEDFPYQLGALSGLSLEDEKGRLLPESVQVKNVNRANKMIRELRVTYRPAAGRRPEKLVFSGRLIVTLNIPFALKDVPLE